MGVMLKLLFFFPVYILPSQTFETRSYVERHILNDDGSLNGSSIRPDCGNGRIINFIAYSYQEWQCHFSDVCRVEHEEPFSPAAEFLLHKRCSGKTKCDSLSFPDRSSEQKERTNSVYLEYSCLDQARTFINMCEDGVTNFNETVYVTSDNTAELFSRCECFVNKDKFSLTVTDLRLTTHGDQCLSAIVFINNNKFACDAQKGGFGSVFHRGMIRSATNAFISLKFNSTPISPDRIFISLTPKDTVPCSVECIGIPRYDNSETTSILQSPNTTDLSLPVRYSGLQIGIGIATPVVIIAIIGMVVFACRKYTGLRQSWYTRFHSWFGQTRNVFAVTCCCDKESETNERSVNRRERSERYPMKANCKVSAENEVMIKNAGAENGKIQSPPNKETETGFISLNPGAATTSVPDQTDSTLCASESISTKNPLLPVPDLPNTLEI